MKKHLVALLVAVFGIMALGLVGCTKPEPPVEESIVSESMESSEAPAPAEGEAAPAEGEAAPAEGEAAPAEGEAAPAEGEAAPAEGEAKPAEGEAAPAEGH